MIYFQQQPIKELNPIIKSFWMIDHGNDATIKTEKIIPDGFPEMIFHYGDVFKININGFWQEQKKDIVAGQIKNHFFLQNTGKSRMFAIKFQPWALYLLFQLDMHSIVNQVIEIPNKLKETTDKIRQIGIGDLTFEEKASQIESWFLNYLSHFQLTFSAKEKIVEKIIMNNGSIDLRSLQNEFQISERSLERYFKKTIGLTPKFYSRIIRFSYIFKLIQQDQIDWQDIVYKAGYYDQSHFIKNFKEFTGEDPTKYGFSEVNMANFFLKK